MDNNAKKYYNNEIKMEFLNYKITQFKSYINAYQRLFILTEEFETLYDKDLYEFSREDLNCFINYISSKTKFMSALLYTDLIKDYKKWLGKVHPSFNINYETCTISDLKNIKSFKKYIIINDKEFDSMTKDDVVINGNDYTPIIFFRLFWEIDGQEKVEDILKLNLNDFNFYEKHITINKHKYPISSYLNSLLYNFSNIDSVTFREKKGVYRILTAEENDGYIFRTSYRNGEKRQSSIGTPMTAVRFSDIFHDFVMRKYTEVFTVNDILMSLALKYMVLNFKTHIDMQTEKRYFSKITSNIYGTLLQDYGKEKYPVEYEQYVNFFNSLKSQQ